jgi:hypothetical protein
MMALFCALLLAPGNWLLAEDAAPAQTAAQTNPPPSPEQIDSLVAPIALYPDELVSQILVASTYPLEIVQAYQWLQQHSDLQGQALMDAAKQQNWDPSIQALMAFPDVLKRMNQDVTWTTNLGNAFLASQSSVMDEIQKMRVRAQEAGKLTSTDKAKVVDTTENGRRVVEIVPASPEVIYVPDYDPAWIWGPPPIYYPYPYWYYPPPPPPGFWCWWGPTIVLGAFFIGWGGWGGWCWHPHWFSRTIVVNNTFIAVNHFHSIHVVNVSGRTVWMHDAVHRMGVAYPNRSLTQHYREPLRSSFPTHITVNQARAQFRAAGERIGSRPISPGVFNHNHTAFGGVEAGAAARTHSVRGYNSLNRMRAPTQGRRIGNVPAAGGNRGAGGWSGGGKNGGGMGGGGWSGGGREGGGWGGGGRH